MDANLTGVQTFNTKNMNMNIGGDIGAMLHLHFTTRTDKTMACFREYGITLFFGHHRCRDVFPLIICFPG